MEKKNNKISNGVKQRKISKWFISAPKFSAVMPNKMGFTPLNVHRANLMGFTLIELLVVISIIGILASFSMVSLNGARIKARDAKRKADMVQTRLALYLYYDDNSQYPKCGTWDGEADDFGATTDCYDGTLSSSLTGQAKPYMADLPTDPKGTGIYRYRYVSTASGDQFVLAYNIEENSEIQIIRGW